MKFKLKDEYKEAREYLEKLISQGVNAEIVEKRPRRSLSQNSLYWLWLKVLSIETGYEKETLHILYRGRYLQREEEYITNIIYPELWDKVKARISGFVPFKGMFMMADVISKSTASELDTKQMTEYMEDVRAHAAQEFNVVLLSPDEENFEYFLQEYS